MKFEAFGRRSVDLVNRRRGMHHGYDWAAEGTSDRALTSFSFPSIAAYVQHRTVFGRDAEFVESDSIRDESKCTIRYDRPLFVRF